ncbi:hypothetical protein YPPY93_2701, partial [Yersinia pestis PY-93]
MDCELGRINASQW